MTNWAGFIKKPEFVGFQNLVTLFTRDTIVWKSALNNIYFLFSVSIPVFLIAIFYSILVSRLKIKGGGFFKTVFFFPNVISVVIITIIWMYIYNPTMGIVNPILESLGLHDWTHGWLGEKSTVMGSLTITMIWPAVGYQMMFYTAGIQNIPDSLYEAAQIEGASEFTQIRKITLPLLTEIIIISFSMFILQTFDGTFRYVWAMTKGGPNHASEILATWMYQKAFDDFNFGYGAMVGVLIFVISVTCSLIIRKILRKKTIEY